MVRNPSIVEGRVPVLSLWQPWASFVVWSHFALEDMEDVPLGERIAQKNYETRSWHTNYRGPVVIHAAARWNRQTALLCAEEPFCSMIERNMPWGCRGFLQEWNANELLRGALPFGALIGTAYLKDCQPTEELIGSISKAEEAFGLWTPGRYAFRLSNPVRFKNPIPYVGRQGWFSVDKVMLPASITWVGY